MTPAQLTLVGGTGTIAEAAVTTGSRDWYLDLLRALAVGQVLLIHVLAFTWIPLTYPAMGVIFAIGASRLAGSLDRSGGHPLPVIKQRLLRLLAPLWAMGAVMVPLMIAFGWTNTADGVPLEATSLLRWIIPISPPPASDLGYDWALPLWFMSCYLWLLLLSPALLWLFRRWPMRTLSVPLGLLVLNTMGLVQLADGGLGDVVVNLATFGSCWLLGFAHHDGFLSRLRMWVVLGVGAALYAIGIACAHAFPTVDLGPAPSEIPLAYGVYSTGFVLVLLVIHPHVRGRLGTRPFLSNLVTAVNRRALTMYLWGNACIALALYLLDIAREQPWFPQDLGETAGESIALALTIVLVLVCALCFGWVEDTAARQPARLNPWPRRTRSGVTSATSRAEVHLVGIPSTTFAVET